MEKITAGNYQLFEFYAIFLTICLIPSVPVLIGEDFVTLIIRLGIVFFFVLFYPFFRKDINFLGILYCGAIIIGFVFHKLQGLDVKLFGEALVRIVPILMLLHYKYNQKYPNKYIKLLAISFFVIECFLAVYEKYTLSHVIDYESDSQAMNVNMLEDEEFRSFSLFGHPLHNANVVSVMLAFIICSSSLKIKLKIILVLLGLGAIWSFNSRAALMMWLFIIFYRLFLYGKSWKWILSVIAIVLVALPSFVLYVQKTGALGRLDFDFSDSSTLTRIMALQIFFSYPWSSSEMILGGVKLEQPTFAAIGTGTSDYVYIENGYLLDLGYWGFILGAIKIIGEILISYRALHHFNIKDKFIIMIALWGIASMNNNTFFTFLMPFYLFSFLAFGVNQRHNEKLKVGAYKTK